MFLVTFINRKYTIEVVSSSVNSGTLDKITHGIRSFFMCEREDAGSFINKKNIRPTM